MVNRKTNFMKELDSLVEMVNDKFCPLYNSWLELMSFMVGKTVVLKSDKCGKPHIPYNVSNVYIEIGRPKHGGGGIMVSLFEKNEPEKPEIILCLNEFMVRFNEANEYIENQYKSAAAKKVADETRKWLNDKSRLIPVFGSIEYHDHVGHIISVVAKMIKSGELDLEFFEEE